MYYALYRKYRPTNFSEVVGQKVIVETLKNSIKYKCHSHAYIFGGPRGTGKTTISKIFAKAINCENPKNGDICNECNSCLSMHNQNNVDIIEIDAASNNGVEEIREIKSKVLISPTNLKYKVYIIDEVHMLSIGAFNALLKTLEEPPEHVIFILATTDVHKIPETIISRCQTFSFDRISEGVIVKRMTEISSEEGIDIEKDVLEAISSSVNGGMRDALNLLDKLNSYKKEKIYMDDFSEVIGTITEEEVVKILKDIELQNISEILRKINEYYCEGKNLYLILKQIIHKMRDIIVESHLKNTEINTYREEMLFYINEKSLDIRKSDDIKIAIELMFLECFTLYGTIGNEKKQKEKKVEKADCVVLNENTSKTEPEEKKEIKNNEVISDRNNKTKVEIAISQNTNAFAINLDKIIDVRLNNALVKANKMELAKNKDNLGLLNKYAFDPEIGYYICGVCDSVFRVASEEIIVLSYEYKSKVEEYMKCIQKMEEIYNEITDSNVKFAIITDDEWDKVKEKYILNKKSGKNYILLDEPILEYELDENLSNPAEILFGNVVEIEKEK